jgi:hypothetical protein
MSAAELRGIYMANTLAAYAWLVKKLDIPSRRKNKHQKERHSIWRHNFYYVPAHGEVIDGDLDPDVGRSFVVARVASTPRRSIVGELVSGQRPPSAQHWVLEVHFGELQRQTKNEPAKYKFDMSDCCSETYDNCGEANQCALRHAHKIFIDVVLPPLALPMVQQKARQSGRKQRAKKQKTCTAQSSAPEFWVLPPGSEQKIMGTLSDDQQAGVSCTMRV